MTQTTNSKPAASRYTVRRNFSGTRSAEDVVTALIRVHR